MAMLNAQSSSESLVEMATGYAVSKAIYASVELEVAERLAESAMVLDDLAEATGADAGALRRLLAFLINHGMFSLDDHGRYKNNHRSEFLRPDTEGSLANFIRLVCGEQYMAFDGLLASVRTGRPVFADYFGHEFFSYVAKNDRMKLNFHKAMGVNRQDELIARGIAMHIPDRAHLVDVGGGNGNLVFSLLRLIPGLTAEVFDTPEQVVTTRGLIHENGMSPRCDVSGGDFFKAVPRGGVMILKRILHNWSAPQIAKLLANCRQSLNTGGRLFIIERLLSDDSSNRFAQFSDLSMLVLHTGRERDAREYGQLLVSGGFELVDVHGFGIDMVAIEAK